MRQMGIAVVGLGDQGPRYARLVAELRQADLIATCSRTEARAREVAAAYGAKRWYTDYRKMVLDPDIEGVIIATEVDRHVEVATAALEANKHVFVEKPLTATPSVEETDKVLALAEEQGRILMLAWVERYDPRCARVKEKIDKGELGKIVSVFIRRNGHRWHFEKPRFQKHPWIWEPGVHSIDLLLWFVGEPVMEVYACGGEVAETGFADTFWVTIRFVSGAVGVIEQVSNTIPDVAAPTGDREIEVIGTEGTIRWFEPNDSFVYWTAEGTQYLDSHWYYDVGGISEGALKNQLLAFLQCMESGEKPKWGTSEEIRTVAIVGKAILKSMRTHQIVRIETKRQCDEQRRRT